MADAGRVRVEPLGVTFELGTGESLMDAATRAGYDWPTICKGNAQCNRCFVRVEVWHGVVPATEAELDGLRSVRWRGSTPDRSERLACRMTVVPGADAVVVKRGVRPRGVASDRTGTAGLHPT